MKTLAWFLLYDVGCNFNDWIKEWVVNFYDTLTGINSSAIEKAGGEIFISSDIHEDFDEIKISKQGFLGLIDSWNKVCKQKTKKITLTSEMGCIHFESNA